MVSRAREYQEIRERGDRQQRQNHQGHGPSREQRNIGKGSGRALQTLIVIAGQHFTQYACSHLDMFCLLCMQDVCVALVQTLLVLIFVHRCGLLVCAGAVQLFLPSVFSPTSSSPRAC